MPNTIKFSDNPNEETAFVETDDGQRTRAVLTAAVDGEIEFPANPNSTKVSVTVDGVKRKAIAVATIAGGGDQHNLGYYATQAALQEAHATAEAGDWAIVGATDTVWIWDEDTSAWVDSDQKGQVTSVNGQTGEVSLSIPDAVQYSTMPTASADNLGDIVQFTGTTDANYTNGYFYKCGVASTTPASATIAQTTGSTLSDLTVNGETFWEELEEYDIPQQTGDYAFTYNGGTGYWDYGDDYFDLSDFGVTYTGTPADGDVLTISVTAPSATYAWTRVDVQPAPVIPDPLPSQTGQSGKFLTTDGTDASWSDKPLVNGATVANSVIIDRLPGGGSAGLAYGSSVSVGYTNALGGSQGVIIGAGSGTTGIGGVALGYNTRATAYGVAIGRMARASANYAIQLGGDNATNNNTDANTFKVGNANGNFEIMSADGTIPEARLADTTNAQQGDVLTLDGNGNAVWAAGGGGGGSYTAGNGISIDANNEISVADPVIINKATYKTDGVSILGSPASGFGINIGNSSSASSGVAIGFNASSSNNGCSFGGSANSSGDRGISIGAGAYNTSDFAIAIGPSTSATAYGAISIGGWSANSTPGTMQVGLGSSIGNWVTVRLLDSDGTIPADRLASTTGLADGNYRLRLTMSNGTPTLSWVAE